MTDVAPSSPTVFGGTRRARHAHAARLPAGAKVMPIEALDDGLQSATHLVVVDPNGRRLLLLNDRIVPREQKEVLVNDMIGRGAALEHVPGRVTIGQFARAHPGALPPHLAHRVRFLQLVALGTLLVMGVAAAVSVAGVISSFAS